MSTTPACIPGLEIRAERRRDDQKWPPMLRKSLESLRHEGIIFTWCSALLTMYNSEKEVAPIVI